MAAGSVTGDRTALVTGSSSGIGAELARQAAGDGYDVVLTARREDRLRELAGELETKHGITATVIPQDLARDEAAAELFDAVREAGITVHTLVNNAGIPVYGRFTETDLEDELRMMQVNMTAVTALTKRFLRPMVERGEGAILNTASLASLYPMAEKAVYSSSKAYVLSFSRALAHEMDGTDITVTALCPGVVETEYAQRGNVGESETMEGVTNDPESVARAGWDGLKNGERIVFPSHFATYASQIPRFLPRTKVTELGTSVVEEGASWI